jgi:hypothetical protein
MRSLFFNRWKAFSNPSGLQLGVSLRESFSRALNGEAKLTKQLRHVVRVIVDAKSSADPVADHRPSPHTGGEADALRPSLDDADQLVSLVLI